MQFINFAVGLQRLCGETGEQRDESECTDRVFLRHPALGVFVVGQVIGASS